MTRSRRFAIYVLGWALATLFYFTQDFARRLYRGDAGSWMDALIPWMLGNGACLILTPVILWSGRRWPLMEGRWRKPVPILLLITAICATCSIAIETPLVILTGKLAASLLKRPPLEIFMAIWVYGFHGDFLAYWIILGIQAAARSYRELEDRRRAALQLELQLSDARLSALKMQLQPHFLFNTLSAIMVLVRQQKTRQAEEMLSRLSDLLRRVLTDSDAQQVSLRRELEFLKLYLAIEQVRFPDRLTVDVAPVVEAMEAAVPHLGLQPIVENAVRHGLGRSLESVHIELTARRHADILELIVKDDGPGLRADRPTATGIGLANTRARLRQLYGTAAQLDLTATAPHGVTVTIRIPFRLASEVEACA